MYKCKDVRYQWMIILVQVLDWMFVVLKNTMLLAASKQLNEQMDERNQQAQETAQIKHNHDIVFSLVQMEVLDDSNAFAAQDQHHMSDRFETLLSPAAINKRSGMSHSQGTTAHCKPPLCRRTQEWTHSAQSTNAAD